MSWKLYVRSMRSGFIHLRYTLLSKTRITVSFTFLKSYTLKLFIQVFRMSLSCWFCHHCFIMCTNFLKIIYWLFFNTASVCGLGWMLTVESYVNINLIYIQLLEHESVWIIQHWIEWKHSISFLASCQRFDGCRSWQDYSVHSEDSLYRQTKWTVIILFLLSCLIFSVLAIELLDEKVLLFGLMCYSMHSPSDVHYKTKQKTSMWVLYFPTTWERHKHIEHEAHSETHKMKCIMKQSNINIQQDWHHPVKKLSLKDFQEPVFDCDLEISGLISHADLEWWYFSSGGWWSLHISLPVKYLKYHANRAACQVNTHNIISHAVIWAELFLIHMNVFVFQMLNDHMRNVLIQRCGGLKSSFSVWLTHAMVLIHKDISLLWNTIHECCL